MSNWTILKESMFPAVCAICGLREARDLDHAIFSGQQSHQKRQGKAWRDWLDSWFNAQPACEVCNVAERTADTYASRVRHVERMMLWNREGFINWLHSAPDRGPRWDEIERLTHG